MRLLCGAASPLFAGVVMACLGEGVPCLRVQEMANVFPLAECVAYEGGTYLHEWCVGEGYVGR